MKLLTRLDSAQQNILTFGICRLRGSSGRRPRTPFRGCISHEALVSPLNNMMHRMVAAGCPSSNSYRTTKQYHKRHVDFRIGKSHHIYNAIVAQARNASVGDSSFALHFSTKPRNTVQSKDRPILSQVCWQKPLTSSHLTINIILRTQWSNAVCVHHCPMALNEREKTSG